MFPGAYLKVFDLVHCYEDIKAQQDTAQAALVAQAAAVAGKEADYVCLSVHLSLFAMCAVPTLSSSVVCVCVCACVCVRACR